ncbi:hypothetical protein K402DRAFT_152429 [Aulographum hederae CBS 113979]|uniref:Uncharacterized protein n=1 Tax=Aulographum hederae CBS 113979 TaxID=1176131 RepID=A0A6G1GT64_9PEZI|nr:hypothetical protein K402DRAFT_152429 [Aulographum hederae CBS 113979]
MRHRLPVSVWAGVSSSRSRWLRLELGRLPRISSQEDRTAAQATFIGLGMRAIQRIKSPGQTGIGAGRWTIRSRLST